MASKLTSVNAGFIIFLYFFHSSPSEESTLGPNRASGLYVSRYLGKTVLDDKTSYVFQWSAGACSFPGRKGGKPYFDSASVGDRYYRGRGRNRVLLKDTDPGLDTLQRYTFTRLTCSNKSHPYCSYPVPEDKLISQYRSNEILKTRQTQVFQGEPSICAFDDPPHLR